MLAVIGGTGLRRVVSLDNSQRERIPTRFGEATVVRGKSKGHEVLFLCRHGEDGSVPPHRINYRANIAALSLAGVDAVIATAAVGGISHACTPGALGLMNQFIDFTHSRDATFFDSPPCGPCGPVHVDMTCPFCPGLRSLLARIAGARSIELIPNLTYACAQGPRFETPAEIRMMGQLGADVVGMTLVPEVVLAREAGLCYASVAVVTNFAAGISPAPLSHLEVLEVMEERATALTQLIEGAVAAYLPTDCPCTHSLDEYGLSFRSLFNEPTDGGGAQKK